MDRDAVGCKQVGGATVKHHFGPTVRKAPDADVAPSNRSRSREDLECLEDRFLRGEASSERRGWVTEGVDVGPFVIGQGAVENPLAMAVKQRPRPNDFDHIKPDPDYGHGRRHHQS